MCNAHQLKYRNLCSEIKTVINNHLLFEKKSCLTKVWTINTVVSSKGTQVGSGQVRLAFFGPI